ncbi:MAG: cytochrome c3 family protein, partial [Fidelibacterota bacterium]
ASILGRWEELMMRKVDVLGKTFEIVRREVDVPHIPVQSRKQALDQIEKATFNFQLVKQGNVVHNVAYSDELLFSAYESLKRALKIVGSKTEIPDLSVYSKMVPSECKNCHYGGEQVTVEVFGINFSHNIHIVKNRLPCSQCHSSMRRHGELVVTRNECLSCHHTQDMVTCEKCHTLQAQIFQGNVLFATRLSPDAMYEEGVECRSCHEGTVQPIEKATPAKCSECHDTEYEQLFGEWQTETEKSMAQISQRLRVMGEKDFTQAEKLKADSIRKTLEMIEKDRSKGVHNMALIRETLSQYRGVLDSLVTRRVSP